MLYRGCNIIIADDEQTQTFSNKRDFVRFNTHGEITKRYLELAMKTGNLLQNTKYLTNKIVLYVQLIN